MYHKSFLLVVLFTTISLVMASCGPTPSASPPTATNTPTATPRPPERNIALNKPVRVSASWVVDPPERAVNGNPNDWWGAGGPPPHWIEVDLLGIYTVTRIKVINEGPTGMASYPVYGRGPDRVSRLLHTFGGVKLHNQTLEYTPETPWEGISTIRIEIPEGDGWTGFREIQVFSREEPEPLPVLIEPAEPLYLAPVDTAALETIMPENAVFMEQIAMLGRGTINELAWSPDGTKLAAASTVGVWLYDPADLDDSPRLLESHTRDVLSVAYSPDGKTLLSASQDGTVKEWDAATGDLERSLNLWADFSHEIGTAPREMEVWSVAFSPDRTLLAAGQYDGTLRLWNLASRTVLRTFPGHSRTVNALAFSPDGALLASASQDGALLIWVVENGSQMANISVAGPLESLVFSPDGRTLAYGGGSTSLHLWDTTAGAPAVELTEPATVLSLAFSPDGKTLASSSLDGGRLRFFDMESGSTTIFKEGAGWNMSMAFSPDGKTLATYGWDGALRLWDVASGEVKDTERTHINAVNSVAFDPDNTLLATGSQDGVVRLWDVKANRLQATLLGHTAGVTGVAFSPDGTLLASSSFDRTVTLWDGETGMPIDIFQGHTSFVRCVAFSPDGTLVASGSTDRTVRLWDVTTGEERFVLSGHTAEIQDVDFSRDGLYLLSGSADKTVKIWEVATGQEIGSLQGGLGYVLGAAFSPDGTLVASVGGDHSLRAQDLEIVSGAATGSEHFPAIGHPGWVMSVAFSPDGVIIASANLSTTSYWVTPGEVHLYSSEDGFPLALLRGHTKRVTSIAFSMDGKLLASGSADGTVRLWGVRQVGAASQVQPATGKPTATPTPTASPISSTWRDDFDGSLGDGWRWIEEKSDKWNLAENPGFLRIYASHASTGSQNLLLRPAPRGDFTITTHMLFEPNSNYQLAGLVIYQDADDFLQFGRAFCNVAGACVGNGIYFDNLQGGTLIGGNYVTATDTNDEAYLRLERKGDTVTAYFSYEGVNWFVVGSHSLPPGFRLAGVGLTAAQDNTATDPDIPADFDFFELVGGP